MGVLSTFTFRSYNEGVLREIQNEKRNEVIHIMKKIITFALAALLALSLAACGSEPKTDDTAKTDGQTQTQLTGTVSTDGSTSMEKVIGALSESYMAANGGVQPHRLRLRHHRRAGGHLRHRAFLPRSEGRGEVRRSEGDRAGV